MKTKTQTKIEKVKKSDRSDRLLSFGIVAAFIFFVITLVPYFFSTGEKIVVAQQISSEAFEALLSGGIGSSNTVELGDTVKVSYQLPETLRKDNADMYILGVLSVLAPYKEKAVITAYSGENRLGTTEVQMADIVSFKNKVISQEEFKNRFKHV